MTSFEVLSIFRHDPPRARGTDEILATMTISHGAVLISGAHLLRSDTGRLRISLCNSGRNRRVFVRDREAYSELIGAVLKSYAASGGNVADPPFARATFADREDQHEIA